MLLPDNSSRYTFLPGYYSAIECWGPMAPAFFLRSQLLTDESGWITLKNQIDGVVDRLLRLLHSFVR